ncbi:uncharacterized protein BCR38DRAFT_429251 [Pseudomassariella vexata]|uniref:Mid2 domain-containing protein n=1 Tax=Pseudomassariella vexata TaxID=1141098 RepID=A0A1Y2E3I6_9PEZI|nr:uncharacterized protein BCR38DRAFT_429251 [Pseudomassariella vexata]ORY66113.1 hypothetical protein BCR38DRAFT_429251 [Pseudomassariella vexata]
MSQSQNTLPWLLSCVLALAVARVIAAKETQCFFPHGNVHSLGQPCDPNATGAVPCCQAGHTCLSNSLCWDPMNSHVVRGSCTDSTFRDPACPRYCFNNVQGDRLGNLRQCNNQSTIWTCRGDVNECTNNFTIPTGYINDHRDSSSSGVMYVVGNSTSVGESSDRAVDTAKSWTGLGVGLGVGLPLLLALTASLWFLWKARRELTDMRRYRPGDSAQNQSWNDGSGTTSQATKPQYSPNLQGYQNSAALQHSPSQHNPTHSSTYQQPSHRVMSPQELDGNMSPREVPATAVAPPIEYDTTTSICPPPTVYKAQV